MIEDAPVAAVDEDLGPAVTGFLWFVAVVAGISALALLALPGTTDRYFSWTLSPPAAASLIGAFYLASSVVFGWAATLRWIEVRSLLVGVLGLAVPTFVVTLVHDEVFDFDRWQAIGWLVLFAAAPVVTSVILIVRRSTVLPASRPLVGWTRAALAIAAVGLAVLAVTIWLDTTSDAVSDAGPLMLVGLTGKYLGAWCSFLAVLSGWAAVRGRWDEARVPVVALGVAGIAVLLGAARSWSGLGTHRGLYLAAAVAITVLAGAMYAVNTRAAPEGAAPAHS